MCILSGLLPDPAKRLEVQLAQVQQHGNDLFATRKQNQMYDEPCITFNRTRVRNIVLLSQPKLAITYILAFT